MPACVSAGVSAAPVDASEEAPDDDPDEVPEVPEVPDSDGGVMPGWDFHSGKEGDVGDCCICTSAGGCGPCGIVCTCAKAACEAKPNVISKHFEVFISEIS